MHFAQGVELMGINGPPPNNRTQVAKNDADTGTERVLGGRG